MVDHLCPNCSTVFEAVESPTGVTRECPACGTAKARPVRPKGRRMSVPTGVTGFVFFVLCFVICALAPHVRCLLGYGHVAVVVIYLVALPLCIHGMFSAKEIVVSRVLGTIGFSLILILTVAEILLRMQR